MDKGSNRNLSVYFTEEFNKCLDQIQAVCAEQWEDFLEWWFTKEGNMIEESDHLLSSFPYAGKRVDEGSFRGFRCLTYGKSRHRMLNYFSFYTVYEDKETI